MDEWILETTRPHKHATIFGTFFVNFFSAEQNWNQNSIFFQHTSTMGDFNYKQEKRNFPHIIPGLPRVREMSGKNEIFSRSGKSQGILKKCQGILAI